MWNPLRHAIGSHGLDMFLQQCGPVNGIRGEQLLRDLQFILLQQVRILHQCQNLQISPTRPRGRKDVLVE